MIDTSIIRQGNIFIRIFSQKSALKSILFGKDADKKIRRIRPFEQNRCAMTVVSYIAVILFFKVRCLKANAPTPSKLSKVVVCEGITAFWHLKFLKKQ